MCCNCCSVRQQKIWVFSIGSILTVLGIIMASVGPKLSDDLIDAIYPLAPNSIIYNRWVVTPMPLYMSFYLFNWTNPEELNNPNVKPNFQEHGPYEFRDYKVKEQLQWDNVNNWVHFYGRRTFTFDPVRSNGSLDDEIISPNIAVVAASDIGYNLPKVLQKIINFGLNREGGTLYWKNTAIEWLFQGYYDDLVDFVWKLHSPILPIFSDEYAYFYRRNNSVDIEGNFTIHTGKGDLSQMGDLKRWRGNEFSGNYEGECGRINGSTGELWSPKKKFSDSISIFISDAGRYVNIFPHSNVTYRGIDAFRYESTDQTFDNGYIAPDTKCFCVKNRECPKNGVIDFSPQALGAPAYVSHPHFYMTDPMYRENTTGLNPRPADHGIHVVMEPKYGIPLSVLGHVMVSLKVRRNENIDFLKDVAHEFYAPMFTIQIKAEINDELLDFLKLVLSVPTVVRYTGVAFLCIGVIMIGVGIWVTKTKNWRGQNKLGEKETLDSTSS